MPQIATKDIAIAKMLAKIEYNLIKLPLSVFSKSTTLLTAWPLALISRFAIVALFIYIKHTKTKQSIIIQLNKPTNNLLLFKLPVIAQTIIETSCQTNTQANNDKNIVRIMISLFKNGLSLLEYSNNLEFI